jgi:hypothetical protein
LRSRLRGVRGARRKPADGVEEYGMRSTGARIGLALVVMMFASSHVSAQQSACAKVQAVLGVAGYQLRAGDPRCEGFYQSPVGGASLELLSLTAGPVDYRLRPDGILRIVAPDLGELKSDHVKVQARALPLNTYYQMDATIPSGQSMSWPMATVLAPRQLESDTIGVTAWIERDAKKIYVPVRVSDESGPAPSGAPVVAIIRATADLDDLRWRDPDRPSEWNMVPRRGRVLRAGQPIPIPLQFEIGRDRTIEVKGKKINSDDWTTLQLRIHAP